MEQSQSVAAFEQSGCHASDWMLRSYTVTFAFVTFRLGALWVHRWLGLADDDPVADSIDSALAWACWAIPLLLAEPLIQLRSMRRPVRGI